MATIKQRIEELKKDILKLRTPEGQSEKNHVVINNEPKPEWIKECTGECQWIHLIIKD